MDAVGMEMNRNYERPATSESSYHLQQPTSGSELPLPYGVPPYQPAKPLGEGYYQPQSSQPQGDDVSPPPYPNH